MRLSPFLARFLSCLAVAQPICPVQTLIRALETIAPSSAATPCIDNPTGPGECRSASQAAAPISSSLELYGVTSLGEQTALLSLMAFETGEFKFNRNHFPGVPGQGTRNMQSATFNSLYAASIPALAPAYAKVSSNVTAVLNLLLTDDRYDFGSAAWFLTTQCSPAVRTALQTGSEAGWENYLTGCVGTTVTEDRKAFWLRARDALGT